MLDAAPGTSVAEVERMLHDAYVDSGFAQPSVNREQDWLYVSLQSQAAGDATVATFQLEDDLVVGSSFSPD